jgi:hypothetical protein
MNAKLYIVLKTCLICTNLNEDLPTLLAEFNGSWITTDCEGWGKYRWLNYKVRTATYIVKDVAQKLLSNFRLVRHTRPTAAHSGLSNVDLPIVLHEV